MILKLPMIALLFYLNFTSNKHRLIIVTNYELIIKILNLKKN